MKSYREYYKHFLKKEMDWIANNQECWWHKDGYYNLDVKGDYIESVGFLNENKKNDSPVFDNHTNVRNSEWSVLFDMLAQALIDWCVENGECEDLWSYYIFIKRGVCPTGNSYEYEYSVSVEDTYNKKPVDDERMMKFDECSGFLCDIIDEFISTHGKDIPNDWEKITFGLDDIKSSCKHRVWCSNSDGVFTMSLPDDDHNLITMM